MEAPYFLPEHIFRDKCMYVHSLYLMERLTIERRVNNNYKGVTIILGL